MAPVIKGDRTFSGNTVGNGNVFVQGSVHVNSPAEGSQRRGENETLDRLYKSPYRDRKDRNPPRVPGTCDWFVSHEHFQTWNESNSSAMLWVSADPGCGKSVLVRHLIDSIVQTTESRTVCYFFFKDDFSDQRNVTSALSCILRQIFIQRPSLLSDEILKKFNSGGETFNTSFSELWQIFMQVAEDKDAGEIVCLLDAIDECEDQSGQGRSELLKALCTLYGTRRGFNLKFLLTSRPYVDIHRSLEPLQIPGLPVIHLSGESEDEIKKISQEINTYIDARVQDVGKRLRLSKDECDLLLQKLMQIPNRTYLWVYLILNFIENSINVSKIMIIEATLNIPTTVDEAYERILSKSFDTRQARKALHIIVAASRPLTLGEMNFALALDEGHKSYNDLGLLPDDRFRETLRNICGLCVVIVDSKVYLLHQTVKEFLVKEDAIQVVGSDRGDHEWKRSLDPQESHRILAEICIWHLLAGFKMRYGSPARHAWCEIFLDYSAKHWALHFRQIPIEIQSMMTESTLLICDVDPSFCKEWFSIYWTTTNTKFPEGFTTLMMTSYFGLNFAVSNLLNIADIELDTQDSTYRRTALSWAARNGWHTVSELLLKGVRLKLGAIKLPVRKKPTVDLQDIYGRAPLTYAVWNRDVTLVQLLIKAGAQANLKDELEGTPLSYAFCNGNVHIIDLLAKKKRRADIENDINRLLLSAARKGHEEVMSLLLKTNRANIEAQGPNGRTALIIAADGNHWEIMKLLVKAGANVNAQDKYGRTALMKASSHGYEAEAIVQIDAGANVNAQDKNRETEMGYEAIVKRLIEAGADVNALDKNRRTALIEASSKGREGMVKWLIKAGADVNAQDEYRRTALVEASRKGHEAIVKRLIEAGTDVNAQNEDLRPALIEASSEDREGMVKWLIKKGADVNALDKNRRTALIEASWNNHEAIVKRLIEAGADVNAQDEYRRTALIWASQKGHEAIVKRLIEAGADVNAQDEYRRTALIEASWNNHEAIVKRLIKEGADVNAQDEDRRTALIWASWSGHEAIVKRLVEAGADVNVWDKILQKREQNGCRNSARFLSGLR